MTRAWNEHVHFTGVLGIGKRRKVDNGLRDIAFDAKNSTDGIEHSFHDDHKSNEEFLKRYEYAVIQDTSLLQTHRSPFCAGY